MKKSMPSQGSLTLKKAPRSPVSSKKSICDEGYAGSSSLNISNSNVRAWHTPNNDSHLSYSSIADGSLHSKNNDSEDDSFMMNSPNNGSFNDITNDEVDAPDETKTKEAIQCLHSKIQRAMHRIKREQDAKEDNVNEYLRLSANADKMQQPRIKDVFEKKNQKSTHSITALQRKLENYQKRSQEIQQFGLIGQKPTKGVLRDVGQGIKGVVDNIRGAKDTLVTKPKEIAQYLLKNKFGSADNITGLRQEGEEESESPFRNQGGGTLPASYVGQENVQLITSFKYGSEEDNSSVTSESVPSGTQISPATTSAVNSISNTQITPSMNTTAPSPVSVPLFSESDLSQIISGIESTREQQQRIMDDYEIMKEQMEKQLDELRYALFEEKSRSERLEEQINDLTELNQHEISNIKQELSSMEEKMEYQLEERTRDMQELLESCQTRITKMEMQQQQQHMVSMEVLDKSNVRELFTKLLNIVLSILAVLFLLISTIHNLLSPFLTTRLRILSTGLLIVIIIVASQKWPDIEFLLRHFFDYLHR